MYKYFTIISLLILLIFLYALNLNIKSSEILIYKDGAVLKVDNELDLSKINIFDVYGRYIIIENFSYIGKEVKFIWNKDEKTGIVEKFENGMLLIKDSEGFIYRLTPDSVVFKETDLNKKVIKPLDNTYVSISGVGWKGKNILIVNGKTALLDIGFELYNNNYIDINADTITLIDTHLLPKFYPKIQPMYLSQEDQIVEGRVLDSKVKYKIENLMLPARSRLSKSIAKYELELNRTNNIVLSMPYTRYVVYRGYADLSISFHTPTDIASGRLDIYDRSILVTSRDIEDYMKNNIVNINLWQNNAIEYIAEFSNNLVTQDYRTYITNGQISIQLKNNNDIQEDVLIEINIWDEYEVSGDFTIDKGKLIARYKLNPGEQKTLTARFYKK